MVSARPRQRRRLIALGATALVASIAIACSGGDDEAVTVDSTAAATPAAATETATPTAAASPSPAPTASPTAEPTASPTAAPTASPTVEPTASPTPEPTASPTASPTAPPTASPTPEPTATPTEAPAAAAELATDIVNTAFERTITVSAGSTVTWTNQDGVPHTVTSDDGTGYDTEFLLRGDTASRTFDQAGTFTYFCRVHPFMKGTVVVE